jgi:hypothetical protein
MMSNEVKPRVFIAQDDGQLKPVEVPVELARLTAVYRELRALNLSLEEIKFLWAESQTG